MGRSFYLYPRNGVIYAELLDPATGERIASRSTGTSNRDEAVLKVGQWLRDGIPTRRKKARRTVGAIGGLQNILRAIEKTPDLDTEGALQITETLRRMGLISFSVVKGGKGSRDFIGYLKEFWSWEKSPYIREKVGRGYKIGNRHALESGRRIVRNWEPYFSGRTLDSITREDIKAFSLWLGETKNDKGEKYSANYLEPVHTNTASTTRAKQIKPQKTRSSLS